MKKIFTYLSLAAAALIATLTACSNNDEPTESRSEQGTQDNKVQLYKDCFVEANTDFDMEYFIETLVKQGTWLEKTHASHSGKYWNPNLDLVHDPEDWDENPWLECYMFFDDGTFRMIPYPYWHETSGTVRYEHGTYEIDSLNGIITLTSIYMGEKDGRPRIFTPIAIDADRMIWDFVIDYENVIDGQKVDEYAIRSSFEPYTLLCDLRPYDDFD